MALKACSECKREISTDAKTCPHCGKRNPTSSSGTKIIAVIVVVGIIAAIANSGSSSPSSGTSNATAAVSQQGRVDADRIKRERPHADSLLASGSLNRLISLPDSTLLLIRAAADSAKEPSRYAAVLREVARRGAQRVRSERLDSILASAHASKTMDGDRCTRASRARAARVLDAHLDWSDDILAVVMCGWIQNGMTAAQVRASMGAPYHINRSVYGSDVQEQWVYGEFGSMYVYLDNGVVTSWQSSP